MMLVVLVVLVLLWSRAPLLPLGLRWVLGAGLGELWPERASIPPAAPPARGAAPQNLRGQLGVVLLESSLHRVVSALAHPSDFILT